jgi:hypothetical protein
MKHRYKAIAVATAVVGTWAGSTAHAADLGGNCCADLEERIAELEATTARKGNRKVSLSVTGFVAKQLLFFDDGVESNAYVTDTGSISIGTHVQFNGEAAISPGWKAGYSLNIEAVTADSLLVSQNSGNDVGSALAGGGNSIAVEHSYWFIKNDQLGQVSVGLQSSAADNQAILPDASGTLVVANYVLYDSNAFQLRRTDGTLSTVNYGNLANCQALNGAGGAAADCDGIPNNGVRYDTPVLFGFSASVSWAADDVWAVSGRYSGEGAGFKIAGAIAYNESTDESVAANANARLNGGLDVGALQLGGYVQHIATGLFAYGAYGTEFNDTTAALRGAGRISPDGDNWYAKVGWRTQFSTLGHTVFYGEWGENNDRIVASLFDAGVSSTNLQQYGIGVLQEVDAAAMSLWVAWRHYDVDDIACVDQAAGSCAAAGLANGVTNFDDLDVVKAGVLISF